MANLNRVFLIGNLTRDPELRYIPSGDAVANLGLAVNRVYKTKEGEKKEDTCFVTVVVWRKLAEICGEYLSKGSPIMVEGRLQSRNWETNEGEKRSTLEIVASNVQFLGKKGTGSAEAGKSQDAGAEETIEN
jgi:single-strand DNA-binding protein